jgi:geranylgeranyl diphosphate synthase, type II
VIIEADFIKYRQRIDHFLAAYLPPADPTKPLHQAMHYAVIEGGKRLRPLLVYLLGEVLEIPLEKLDQAACAIEFLHAYSLIHDDLPIMDNDDWRRNRPSCHKVFGDAIALLAGNALQVLSFEVLLKAPLNPSQILVMVGMLVKAAGLHGIVGGQAMEFSGSASISDTTLEIIYRLKTGSLFRAALELTGVIANVPVQILSLFAQIGDLLGQIYQLQDDICDNTADSFLGLPATKKAYFQGQLRFAVENTEALLPALAKRGFLPLLRQLFVDSID